MKILTGLITAAAVAAAPIGYAEDTSHNVREWLVMHCIQTSPADEADAQTGIETVSEQFAGLTVRLASEISCPYYNIIQPNACSDGKISEHFSPIGSRSNDGWCVEYEIVYDDSVSHRNMLIEYADADDETHYSASVKCPGMAKYALDADNLTKILNDGNIALSDVSDIAVVEIAEQTGGIVVSDDYLYIKTSNGEYLANNPQFDYPDEDSDGLFVGCDIMSASEYASELKDRISAATPTSVTPTAPVKFDDCSDSDVELLGNLGLINGTSDGKFSPDATLTRAQAIKLLAFGETYDPKERLTDEMYAEQVTEFSDVSDDFWAAPYIRYASYKSWIEGYEDGTLKPNEDLTDTQFAAMLLRSAGYSSYAEANGGFPDGYIEAASESGLYNNIKNEPITRLDAAHMLVAYLDIPSVVVEGYSLEGDSVGVILTTGKKMMTERNIYRMQGEVKTVDQTWVTVMATENSPADKLSQTQPFTLRDGVTFTAAAAHTDITPGLSGTMYIKADTGEYVLSAVVR